MDGNNSPQYAIIWYGVVNIVVIGVCPSAIFAVIHVVCWNKQKKTSQFDPAYAIFTAGRRNRKRSIEERRLKIVRNRVFDCHMSPHWRQMAIENTVSIDF